MANRLVSVDANNNLPVDVQEQLVGNVEDYFQELTTQSVAAAATSSAAALSAAEDAQAAMAAQTAAQSAAEQAQAPTDDMTAFLVSDPESATREALLTGITTPGTQPVGKTELTFNVRDFGAVGDGVVNDTTAVQDAVAAAAGRSIFFPSGRYLMTEPVDVLTRTTISGEDGTVLDFSTMTSGTAPGTGSRSAFQIIGQRATAVPLTTAVSANSRSVVAPADSVAVGDVVLLHNTEVPVPGLTKSARWKGELNRIAGVSGTSVTLETPSLFGYSTAGLSLTKITPAADVHISNLTIIMGGIGSIHTGIIARDAERIFIDSVRITGAEDTSISFNTVRDSFVTRCVLRNSTSNAAAGNTGYGVAFVEGTRQCTVRDSSFYRCRHAVAGGGYWPAVFIDVLDNYSSDSLGYAYDCHESTFYWKFSGNTAFGGAGGFIIRGQFVEVNDNTVTQSTGNGIQAQTYDGVTSQSGIRIMRNMIRTASTGILIDGQAVGSEPDCAKNFCEISDNLVHGTTFDAILLRGFNTATVRGNDVASAGNAGIRCSGVTAFVSSNLDLSDNRVSSVAQIGIVLNNVFDVAGAGNIISGSGQDGFGFTNAGRISLSSCTVRSPGWTGFRLSNSSVMSLSNMTVSNVATATYDGIRATGCSDLNVTGGYYQSNRWAIYTTTTDNVVVTGVNARPSFTAGRISVDATNRVVANNLV